MSTVKKICFCAICTALCYVLPLALHPLSVGTLLSPMHIPVLLCGLICGWPYGLFCGVAGPILSSLLSGMPPAAMLVFMIPELCAYGVFTGLLMKWIHTGKLYADLYLSLIPAMLLGRVVGGIVRAVVYLSSAQTYSVALWASSYLLGTLPGIILHLILLPVVVLVLMKARLIPARYPKYASEKG
ncbi:MAG: ECF transporter S component [Oscillospiraceae bacterium]